MANITRTVADTAGFIPQVWAQRALDVLRSNIVLAKLVARDTDYEPAQRGKSVTIPYPGTFTASDKAADTNATVSVPSGGSSVTVSLNSHKYVDFIVEDFARVQASGELLDRYVAPAAIALAEALEGDLFALYTGLASGGGTSGTDLSASTIRTLRKTFNDAKLPQAGRSLVMSTKDEVALLGDSNLAAYFANSNPAGIADGSIGRLFGFDLYVSQLVKTTGSAPVSTKNIGLTNSAIILATRPLDEPTDGVNATTIVDDASGLAIRVMRQYDMNARGHRIGFDILYGAAVLRSTAGATVLS